MEGWGGDGRVQYHMEGWGGVMEGYSTIWRGGGGDGRVQYHMEGWGGGVTEGYITIWRPKVPLLGHSSSHMTTHDSLFRPLERSATTTGPLS